MGVDVDFAVNGDIDVDVHVGVRVVVGVDVGGRVGADVQVGVVVIRSITLDLTVDGFFFLVVLAVLDEVCVCRVGAQVQLFVPALFACVGVHVFLGGGGEC